MGNFVAVMAFLISLVVFFGLGLLAASRDVQRTRAEDRACVAQFNGARTRADTLQIVLYNETCRHFIVEQP